MLLAEVVATSAEVGSTRSRKEKVTAIATLLLGLYDEYLIAYRDRSAALDQSRWVRMVRDPFSAPVIVNGRVVGGWRRSVKADRMAVAVTLFAALRKSDVAAIDASAHAYAGFFGLPLELSMTTASLTSGRVLQ